MLGVAGFVVGGLALLAIALFGVAGYVVDGLAVLAVVLLIAALPLWSKERPADVASVLEAFLEVGRDHSRAYDEFLGIRARDPVVNLLKERLRRIDDEHWVDLPPHYLTEAGIAAVREVLASAREAASA